MLNRTRDFLDLSKGLKNLAELGLKKLDIGGGLNLKYPDALNIDPAAESGFKGTLDDFHEQTGGTMSNKFFNKIVNGKAAGIDGFKVSGPVKIPNDGFKTTTGNDIKGQCSKSL